MSTAGSTACQQTMSTPEEQMTMAIQQLNVQFQQFQETLATILQTAKNELEEQVQNATSTTTHKDPMIRADRLFKLRSSLGAVDQQPHSYQWTGELNLVSSGKAQELRAVYRCERRTSRSREHNSKLTAILCQCRSVCSRRAWTKESAARTQGTNRLRK